MVSVMAETETPLKRQREETQVEEEGEIEKTKRLRPYHHILSILEDEEEELLQDDLSSLMTTLQQELSPDSRSLSSNPEPHSSSHPLPETTAGPVDSPTTIAATGNNDKEHGEEQKESTIIRHLLEASDDELGIPQTQIRLQTEDEDYSIIHDGGIQFGGINNSEAGTTISLFDVHNGLWDFEDFETAHYYNFLQSELFM
ncbi:hypothetical protein NE237_007609 [Protea cynaroides]|uniref:Uncharacterized protein n=1 Tax=Protea cynaroides TaxID=273540 RepID=A0A9Q0KPT9_9MAGN|nr:hypothetical protein NE237_007609 [Protea cynaroides]